MLRLVKWGVLALLTVQLAGVAQAMPSKVLGKGAKRVKRALRWVATEAGNLAGHQAEPRDWDRVQQIRLRSCECVTTSDDFLALAELLVDDLHEMLQGEGSVVPEYAYRVLSFLITDLGYRDQTSIVSTILCLQFYLCGEKEPGDQADVYKLLCYGHADEQWRFAHEQAAFEVIVALLRLTSLDCPLRAFVRGPVRLLLAPPSSLPLDELARAMEHRRASEFCWRPLHTDVIYGRLADLNLSAQQVGALGTLGHVFAMALAMGHPLKSSLLGQLAVLAMYGRAQDPRVLAERIRGLLAEHSTE